uniref:Ribosomal protein S5 n=1 Tax=Nitzschia sp. IriIs04 TaxID=1444690 RepID=A0A0S3QPR3_9STRA|nr:ribosomal protein S5 [Nitzschia sp. IriIs04]BAT70296.1 ribosomal protein S5 [Nitzschia sp. IriIs04]
MKKIFLKNYNKNKLDFIEKIIKIRKVMHVLKKGKKINFQAIVITGNQKGKLGLGIAKGNDTNSAISKAKNKSYKNLFEIPLTKSNSIFTSVIGEHSSAKILLKPSIEGFGIIAGGSTKLILQIAGIKNISAKQIGSRNLLNNSYASINALKNLSMIIEYDKNNHQYN